MEQKTADQSPARLAWRRRLVVLLTLLLLVSVGARVASGGATLMPTAAQPAEAEPPEEPAGWQAILPFVTEGAIAMLIGIAVGIATRLVAKMVLLAIVLFFLATQFLAYKGFVTVDWGEFGRWTKDFVLNISDQADLKSIMQYKLPVLGAFAIGYFLGLKRR